MLKDFKKFLMQGNIVDLAVAVVIGGAFGVVVKSLVANIFTPIIGIPGGAEFASLKFEVNGAKFLYGAFLNDVISFVFIAAAIFFLVVKPMEALASRKKKQEDASERECAECLSDIPVAASKCKFCASPQPAVSGAGGTVPG